MLPYYFHVPILPALLAATCGYLQVAQVGFVLEFYATYATYVRCYVYMIAPVASYYMEAISARIAWSRHYLPNLPGTRSFRTSPET